MTQTLKPIRQQTDVTLRATLTDNGVKVSWADLESITAHIYSERQRIIAGACTVEVDPEDELTLICRYDAGKPQYLGINKLVIQCNYAGQKSTYDKAAFEFVATTDETLEDGTTIEDEIAEVDIDVTDLDTSVLSGAIAAALAAADAANTAAAAAVYGPMIGENGNWWVYDQEAGEYTDTKVDAAGTDGKDGHSPYIGENGNWWVWNDNSDAFQDSGVEAQGPEGKQGPSGALVYPTFEINAALHLVARSSDEVATDAAFKLDENKHFILQI